MGEDVICVLWASQPRLRGVHCYPSLHRTKVRPHPRSPELSWFQSLLPPLEHAAPWGWAGKNREHIIERSSGPDLAPGLAQ